MLDDRQRAISYGQATNIAADYILSAFPPGELKFADFQTLLDEYSRDVYTQIIKNQQMITKTVEVVKDVPAPERVVKSIPEDSTQDGRPDEPPLEAYLDAEPQQAAQAFPTDTAEFHFDPEGSTWQVNKTVRCPECGYPSQRWDSKFATRQPNAKGNYPPAFRCGSQKWDKTRPNQYGGKYPGAWVSSQDPPCEWVGWREHA